METRLLSRGIRVEYAVEGHVIILYSLNWTNAVISFIFLTTNLFHHSDKRAMCGTFIIIMLFYCFLYCFNFYFKSYLFIKSKKKLAFIKTRQMNWLW